MSGHNVLNGAQVIVDYLIREKVPHVFGLCGHGNIQFIDALYERAGDIKTISVHHESVAGFMADVYYRVSGRPTATFTSCGPGSANLPISLGNAFLELGAVHGGDRQRADQPVQPRRFPGIVPALPGRLSLDRALLLQEGVSADPRRTSAADGAAGLEDHGHGAAGAGRARRAVRRVPGGGGGGSAAPGRLERQHLQPLRRRSGGRRSRRSTCCWPPSGRRSSSGRACAMAAPATNCCSSPSGCRFRSRPRRAGSAPSTSIIGSRSGSSPAPATTRPITPRARPTCCWRSACASTTAPRARGFPATPSPSRRPSSSMSTSIRRRSAATTRSRSG